MHNFGEKRWGSGIVDDIRSLNDRNTRIIGDFTKNVRTSKIVENMSDIMSADEDWALHFNNVVADSNFSTNTQVEPVVPLLVSACKWLALNSNKFHRHSLQTRFFEVGDNFYLGMELPREYDQWKRNLINQIVAALNGEKQDCTKETNRNQLMGALNHSIDRLWYFACLETIRTADVYNPGARRRVPRLYLINSSIPTALGSLPVGESFRLLDAPQEKYEILAVKFSTAIVRNVEGYVIRMNKSTKVKRENNLTRSPDGNEESRVVSGKDPLTAFLKSQKLESTSNMTPLRLLYTGFIYVLCQSLRKLPYHALV